MITAACPPRSSCSSTSAPPRLPFAATQAEGWRRAPGCRCASGRSSSAASCQATGNDLPARIPAKARWMMGDMALWSQHRGVDDVPGAEPPLALTLRPALALAGVERAHGPAARPAFALARRSAPTGAEDSSRHQRGSGEVARRRPRHAGLAGAAVVAAIDQPETKDQLRATTDEAAAAPSWRARALFVGDTCSGARDRRPLLEAYVARLRGS
ncbi:MAG: hypothetical protein HS111_26895 [Kofleriaceae bacterium]|nr:hypothetical protein [Kofleriaceae bacterium]